MGCVDVEDVHQQAEGVMNIGFGKLEWPMDLIEVFSPFLLSAEEGASIGQVLRRYVHKNWISCILTR